MLRFFLVVVSSSQLTSSSPSCDVLYQRLEAYYSLPFYPCDNIFPFVVCDMSSCHLIQTEHTKRQTLAWLHLNWMCLSFSLFFPQSSSSSSFWCWYPLFMSWGPVYAVSPFPLLLFFSRIMLKFCMLCVFFSLLMHDASSPSFCPFPPLPSEFFFPHILILLMLLSQILSSFSVCICMLMSCMVCVLYYSMMVW